MKIQAKLTIGLLFCAVNLYYWTHSAYSQTIDLSPAQKSALKSLNIPVAVPTYLPNGFKVSQVKIKACPANAPRVGACREGASYEILYRNSENICLSMNAIGGGVGGADSEFQFPIETKLLGKIEINFGRVPGSGNRPTSEQLNSPQPGLYSFPARLESPRTPYYSLRVEEERYNCRSNSAIAPSEFERMLKSLVWL